VSQNLTLTDGAVPYRIHSLPRSTA
jgi:hypothetical protein